ELEEIVEAAGVDELGAHDAELDGVADGDGVRLVRGERRAVDTRAVLRLEVDQVPAALARAKMRVQLRDRRIAHDHVAVARAPDGDAVGIRIARRLGDAKDLPLVARLFQVVVAKIHHRRLEPDLRDLGRLGAHGEEQPREPQHEPLTRQAARQLGVPLTIHGSSIPYPPSGSGSVTWATKNARTSAIARSMAAASGTASGSPNVTRTTAPGRTSLVFLGRMSRLPSIDIGTIGAPVACAMMKPPFLSLPNFPSGERVPSGAIQMLMPRPSASPASRIASIACCRSPDRSTETKPASRIARPQIGTRNSSALATMRSVPGNAT